MYDGGNTWDENPGNLWQEKGLMSTLRTWTGLVAVGYPLGLFVCLVAGRWGGRYSEKEKETADDDLSPWACSR